MQFPRTNKILNKGCDAIVGLGDSTIGLVNIFNRSVSQWDAHQIKSQKVEELRFNNELAQQICEINNDAQQIAKEYGEDNFKAAMEMVKSL